MYKSFHGLDVQGDLAGLSTALEKCIFCIDICSMPCSDLF